MRLKPNGRGGFTLVEIMIVVAIIGLLAAIAIPNFVKARKTAQGNACVNNLRQIDAAIQQFALEGNKKDSDPVTAEDVRQYIRNNEMPKCPTGNTDYNLVGTVGAIPSVTCSNDREGETPRHKLGGVP
jgi:prepilin-type N-terminal cleavage/methylation domain-containing protein